MSGDGQELRAENQRADDRGPDRDDEHGAGGLIEAAAHAGLRGVVEGMEERFEGAVEDFGGAHDGDTADDRAPFGALATECGAEDDDGNG